MRLIHDPDGDVKYGHKDRVIVHQYATNGWHRIKTRDEISEWAGYQQPVIGLGYMALTEYYGETLLAVEKLKRLP